MKLKICGMREQQNIEDVLALNPNYMGFIFYQRSKRFLGYSDVRLDELKMNDTKKVGVFVNATSDEILNTVSTCKLDVVQLHGDETVEQCNELKSNIEVWKAFGICDDFNWTSLRDYEKSCSHFLLDTKSITYGGSGKRFNWNLLNNYSLDHPLILSGGIDIDSLDEVMNLSRSFPIDIIDINSGIEIEPGLKNINLAKKAIAKIRSYELSS